MEHEKLGRILPDGVDPREADELDATWQMLGRIDVPAPDSERMRARIDAVVDAIENSPRVIRPMRWTHTLQGLAAAAVLLIGVGIGWFAGDRSAGSERTRPTTASGGTRPTTASGGTRPTTAEITSGDATQQIAAMRTEMHDLREMVSLSLMQQQSASERLKGVTWTGQLDQPSGEIVSALLEALMHDSNVNVRLATIDALERFATREDVRRGTIQAVQQQQQASPLVQIALIDFMVKTNERESVPTLQRLAVDPQVNAAVRARAAWGLQQLG